MLRGKKEAQMYLFAGTDITAHTWGPEKPLKPLPESDGSDGTSALEAHDVV